MNMRENGGNVQSLASEGFAWRWIFSSVDGASSSWDGCGSSETEKNALISRLEGDIASSDQRRCVTLRCGMSESRFKQDRHVVVVGAGVVGLCVAYYALQRGWRVSVLEREAPAHESCSVGNAGMVVPSHFIPLAAPGMIAKGLRWMVNPRSPFYIRPTWDPALWHWCWQFYRHATAAHVRGCREQLWRWNLRSRELYAEMAQQASFDWTAKGLLMLCKTQAALDAEAEVAQLARQWGGEAQVLSARETALRDPGVTMDVQGSVWFPEDCHLHPGRLMTWLRSEVQRLGGQIIGETEVTHGDTAGGRITEVHAGTRRFPLDALVVAGGVWSGVLLKKLGLRLPLQPGKGYALTLEQPRQLPQLCSILTEAKVAITPMGGKLRVAGTMEVGAWRSPVNAKRVEGITRSLAPYFPEFSEKDFANAPVWQGLRPVSPDGLPYIGRVPSWQNAWVATGHAMMGLSLAPATGHWIAGQLDGETAHPGDAVFAPGRFH